MVRRSPKRPVVGSVDFMLATAAVPTAAQESSRTVLVTAEAGMFEEWARFAGA